MSMTNTNQQIGELISHIRQERGLTQSQFAKLLATSQSAVNRIEHGHQNLSLDTLGKISSVLNKQLISINKSAINLMIEGGRELKGQISLKTSKNSTVGLLCASLLNRGTTTIKNAPKIEEVYRIIEVLISIGVQVKWQDNNIIIKPPKHFNLNTIDFVAAQKTRSVLMFIGPLIHYANKFNIPYAGGCNLGRRTILPHLYGLEEFGVNVQTKANHYEVNVKLKKPTRNVVLYESGDTTTENIIMAASLSEGLTTIKMASANYMVQDLCLFLKKAGVKIEGIGTSTLIIHGLKTINKNISYSPLEDPVEAMTFIAAAITTNSTITIKRTPIEFLELELLKLEKMNLKYTISASYLAENGYSPLVDLTIHKHNNKLVAPKEKIHPNIFPGLNIDHLPYFVPIAAVANGRTLIHDWVYEDRALMYTEIAKTGVNIELADPHRVYVTGPTKFKAADLVCPNGIRPAVMLLIAMLAANGVSVLRNVYTINRGYEELSQRLNELGAKITILHEV